MIQRTRRDQEFLETGHRGHALDYRQIASVYREPAGDGVIEIGRADLSTRGQIVTVKYVVHWKQEDGAWK